MVHALEVSTALIPPDLTWLFCWDLADIDKIYAKEVYLFSTYLISGHFVTAMMETSRQRVNYLTCEYGCTGAFLYSLFDVSRKFAKRIR